MFIVVRKLHILSLFFFNLKLFLNLNMLHVIIAALPIFMDL